MPESRFDPRGDNSGSATPPTSGPGGQEGGLIGGGIPPSGYNPEKTWTLWTIVNGMWVGTPQSGPEPTTGGHTAYAAEWQINKATGLNELVKNVGKTVYGDVGGGPMGKSTGTGTAAKKSPRQLEIDAHYKNEPYFDPKSGQWKDRKVYVPTAAETMFGQKAGERSDTRGYFHVSSGGSRLYDTGQDSRTGRRWHVTVQNGHRVKVWDDYGGGINDSELARRRQSLTEQRDKEERYIKALRRQYAAARADQHLLRNNIMARIRRAEAQQRLIVGALAKLPKPVPTYTIFATENKRFVGGVRVNLSMSIWPAAATDGFSWGAQLSQLQVGARIAIRAEIEFGERTWRPGILGAPDMCRVKWDLPPNWLTEDNLSPDGNDEYVVSNPLYIIRTVRHDGNGPLKAEFIVRCWSYELVLDPSTVPPGAHLEGTE